MSMKIDTTNFLQDTRGITITEAYKGQGGRFEYLSLKICREMFQTFTDVLQLIKSYFTKYNAEKICLIPDLGVMALFVGYAVCVTVTPAHTGEIMVTINTYIFA